MFLIKNGLLNSTKKLYFPVDSLCATFDEIYNGFKNITAGLPENEIQCLFHDNAIKYYNPL